MAYIAIPGPFISILVGIVLWKTLITERKPQTSTNHTTTQLLLLQPRTATMNRLQRAARDPPDTENKTLIQVSLPRHTHVYRYPASIPGYSAESKLISAVGTMNMKKVTTSMHQECEEDEKSAVVGLPEDNKDIKWWNKELSVCVMK